MQNWKVREDVSPVNKEKNVSVVFAFMGWVCFVVSLIFVPILFGGLCFIMGYIVKSKTKHDIHGVTLMVMGVVGAFLGIMFGIMMQS